MRVALDAMVAVYDRRAGITHLLGEPAIMLIDALAAGDASAADLALRLALDDVALPLLTERLGELVATGLVEQT